LARNQLSRLGWGNRILLYALIGLAVILAGSSLMFTIGLGIWFLPRAWQDWMVLVTDGIVVVFLFSWMIGVLSDLQRSEPLSLDKFLHLPVSPTGVFLLNYASSFFSLSLLVFVPTLLGWTLALAVRYGGWLWFGPPISVAFFIMVTAITYQFRGWLGSLMMNKRRRRTIIAVLTLGIILVSQIPNVLDQTLFRAREQENRKARVDEASERNQLAIAQANGEISTEEFDRRIADIDKRKADRRTRQMAELMGWTRIANACIPPLWAAAGIDHAAQGRWAWMGLSLVGMLGLAGAGLWRSYLTTLRIYRGGLERRSLAPRASDGNATTVSTEPSKDDSNRVRFAPNWLERSVPGANSQQATIAWMSIRNMTRAPEAKLAMILPIALVVIVGISMYYGGDEPIRPHLRPLVGLGVCFFAMIGASQLLQNQFGFDRDGFRAFLLAPVTGRDLLIGKNLSLAPIALPLGLIALIIMQVFSPLAWSHFLATVFQLLTMYLVGCLVGNFMSIVVPQGIAPGTLKPTNMKFGAILLQLIIFLLAPLGMLPAIAPLGVEVLLADSPRWSWLPAYLLGAIVYLVVLWFVYRWMIGRQARLFAARKWRILDAVTNVKA
jgi:hypothetical protein